MIETVRSIVRAWECDSVQHFTTAFYFRALSTATAATLQQLGFDFNPDTLPRTRFVWTQFKRELRAGDAYHVVSGVVGNQNGGLRLGHRLFNSESGELCTSFLQDLHGPSKAAQAGLDIDWDRAEPERRVEVQPDAAWTVTSAGVVRPEDTDWFGHLDLEALIHFTSDGNVQFQNSIGMTSSYMRDHKAGFSTAEYQLTLHGDLPPAGTPFVTRSTLAALGRTSLGFVHEVTSRGRTLASLVQLGVHLDLVSRRPSPVPEEIRSRVKAPKAA